ncbi:DUF4279 domain-containing protein [Singulisphaera sp. GP187]|uniref:DUF4279 domain-containing protein n=1 Tax=Singulisphaera sp. GP187 TaxID=1882752 RepID=UPI00135660E1|nr:DUF4279 domain-containing protein [Singulisphaera sp. GP187]
MDDDDYPTCARTYATLLIYPNAVDPAMVTERLGIEPSSWQRRGEVIPRTNRPPKVAELSGWFLTSKSQVESKDSRRHVAWLLDQIASKSAVIRSLQETGCTMAISCYWLSKDGHGGPTMPPSQMKTLGELNIELWFDIYGPYED